MSDQWGTTEPNATGVPPPPPPGSRGGSGFGGNITIADPGFGKIADAISQLTAGMQDLQQTMAGFSQSQHQMSSGVVNTFQNVSSSATTATDSIKTFFQALGGNRPGGSSMASILNYGLESKLGRDIALFPLRYMQSTIGSNRQFALDISGAMSSQQYATGMPSQTYISPYGGTGATGVFDALSRTFGSGAPGVPMGTGQEITQFLNIARQAGGMVDLDRLVKGTMTGGTGQNPRAPGFVQSAYQMQQMYPSMGLGQIGQTLGGFAANSSAQRQGVMLTGGAFSMIKGGGKMKTIDEWAETIFRWLENQRPGPKRGTGFTYDELISQQYPGSNISAWFEANAVPADMQEVWWNYALAKARTSTSGTTIGPAMAATRALPAANLASARLASTQPLTQTSFGLAQSMSGAYWNRESVNRDFNAMIGGLQQRVIPAAAGSVLGFTQAMADPIEELMMSILERSGNFGAGVGGALGWGALGVGGFSALIEGLFGADTSTAGGAASMGGGLLFSGLPTTLLTGLQEWLAESLGRYEVGDIGDSDIGEPWSPEGATTAASLHPSMNRKISAMMKANPKLKINSGRRDEALQQRLKRKGYKNVSGKSSAHTRGLAADLGPRSQYGWLTANAHKYGLKSGAGVGEPWHVGMPGVGDVDLGEAGPDTGAVNDTSTTGTTAAASTATTAAVGGLGALFGLFGGLGGEDYMSTVQNSMPGLFNLMFGGFASDAVANKSQADIDKALAYDPDYAKKVFAATSYKTGGVYGGGNIWDKILAAAKAKNAATFGTQTTTTSTTSGGTGSETLSGALAALGLASTGLSDGAMVALLANKAGFTGTDLTAAVAISKRESSFQPTAHRSDVDKALMKGDRGLWQINAGAWNDLLMEQGFIKDPLDRAIFDPWVNAQIARMIWQRSSNFSAWTMGPNGWDPNGDPFYGTDRNEAEGYVKEAGLGDSDYYPESPAAAVAVGPRTMNFNNTFVVQGGGGNQGMDTRRVVNMLADQLESEMRRRMARSN